MWLTLSGASPLPFYEQIIDRITFAVAVGDLEPGTLIPSVRELAQQLLVAPNTVARAFQELERRGIIEAKRGRGMEVTAEAPALARRQRREVIREQLRHALSEAFASGLPTGEIRQLVQEELHRANGERKTKGES
jgi:GntR family transcriptional regulator